MCFFLIQEEGEASSEGEILSSVSVEFIYYFHNKHLKETYRCFYFTRESMIFYAAVNCKFVVEKFCSINPCPAELFQLYFSSIEAGIANAIFSFK